VKKFLKHFRYGEKGFTLIELLVVIAILGVLAAVVVPNVSRFMGKGKEEAAMTELHNVQTALTALMADQAPVLTTVTAVLEGAATNDMAAFPGADPRLYGALGSRYIQKQYTEYYYSTDNTGAVQGWYGLNGTLGEIGVATPP